MKRLTVASAKAISEPGFYRADPTLYLRVIKTESGRLWKGWVQRVAINGNRHDIGLGPMSLVSLAEAREQAHDNRRLIRKGGNPLAEDRKANAPTFEVAARKVHASLKPTWKNPKHAEQWIRTLQVHAFPKIGNYTVDRITRTEVLSVLTPIWTKTPETAKRVRQRIKAVLAWAVSAGFADINEAGEVLDGALPKVQRTAKKQRSIVYWEVADALEVTDSSSASLAVRLAFRFLVLTATRTTEVLEANWSEIDLETKTWTLSAKRMKAANEHRVPLSDAALEVLAQAKEIDNDSGLIFPSPQTGKALSNMALLKLMRDTGLAAKGVPHGFRASFRTWAEEKTNADHAVKELCLAHTVGSKVEQAYTRSDLLAKRRSLMAKWADYLAGTAATVVDLRAA